MRRLVVLAALLFIHCGDDTTAPMIPKDLSVTHDCSLIIFCVCRDGTCARGGCGVGDCDTACTGHGGGTSAPCPTDGG